MINRKIAKTLILITALTLSMACSKKEEISIAELKLPETPPLTSKLTWAVVDSAYARIYQESDVKSHVMWFVRRGDIYEIVGKEENSMIPVLKGTETVWIEKKDVSLFRFFLQAQYHSRVLLGEIAEKR